MSEHETLTDTIHLIVHYAAATVPFKDDHASRSETVGHLKARVLAAFGLTEGTDPSGNTVSFTLFHKKDPLSNPDQTLGSIAGDQKTLELKLSKTVTQG